MGEHAEAAMAEAKAEVLTTELLAEQADRMGGPAATIALEVRIGELEARAAALERDLDAAHQAAILEYERCRFYWDAAHVLHESFGFELVDIEDPGPKPEALRGGPVSEVETFARLDDLAGACRAIP